MVLVIGLGTLPYWMGSAMRMALPEDSVGFEGYERVGYGRFALTGVSVVSPQATVGIDRIEAYSPLAWIWNAVRKNDTDPFLEMGEVDVVILDSEAEPEESSSELPANLFEAIEMAKESLGLVAYWLPHVSVDSVITHLEGKALTARNILWRESRLSLSATHEDFPEYGVDLIAEIEAAGMRLKIDSEGAKTSFEGELSFGDSVAEAKMAIVFRENVLDALVRFDATGWMPIEANWKATDWVLGKDDLNLGGPYSQYAFDISGDWKDGAYRSNVEGNATPIEDASYALPEVAFASSVSGGLDQMEIESFRLSAPGLDARTMEPVSLSLEDLKLSGEVKFDIDFDLALLKIEDLGGVFTGEAYLSADDLGSPIGRFVLKGADVAYEDLEAERFEIESVLKWPDASIETLDIELTTGSRFKVTGGANLETRQIAPSSVDMFFSEEVIAKVALDGMAIQEVSASATVEGPIDALAHSGELAVGSLAISDLKPLSIDLKWSGVGQSFDNIDIEADNGMSRLVLSAKSVWEADTVEVSIDRLDLTNEGDRLASLVEPATATFSLGELVAGSIETFSLEGEGSKVAVSSEFIYPENATLLLEVQGLDTENWIDPWLLSPVPKARLNNLTVSAKWDDGPIKATALLDAVVDWDESELKLNGEVSLIDESIHMAAFAISDLEGPLMELEGRFPYGIDPASDELLVADFEGVLELSLATSDSPTIIALLDELIPLGVKSLKANANIEGTLANPQGELSFAVITKKGEGKNGLPEALVSANAEIDGATIRVSELVAQVLKQRFQASLEIVFPEAVLKLAAFESEEIDWATTKLKLEAPQSSLAPIAFFVPQLLAPGGTFEARISGSPAGGFSGFVGIEDLNTRPIFPFGSFREIRTRLKIDRTVATLEEFRGNIGREPMTMQGEIDFREIEDLVFDFTVKGENLPIMRQSGLLLRSDLDVIASKERGSDAKIAGDITVKDGLFLMDTSALTESGGGGQSAETRPPYFSVTAQPFADWKLDVAVKGDRFMRLQTPAATGVLSMDMKLSGTLEEPLAIGRVEFDEGALLFPFASFDLTEGLIEMRIEDPYTPILSLLGEARRFRYDLGVEISGSAFDPKVRFTSSPPLSSEQILLMVMAGDVPDSNFNYSASQRASKIGSYLSQGLFSSGGKDSSGGRFSLVTGQDLSEQGKETLEMEFKLDERFQLLGEYDEYDAWNAGLRWRMLRRKPKEETLEEDVEVSE
ncbi:MAG: translocation and assembly module TamB [Candidatus Pelagisphaera sp.]